MDAPIELIPTYRNKCGVPLWTAIFRLKLIYFLDSSQNCFYFRLLTRYSLFIFQLVTEDVKAFGQLEVCT